ncbi:tolloid-like protein 1 isoform X2 [Babylonia areolata]|uniref:tolloid-like protein 1 isoform X2 n=1 Tax=Babylonia areolata TaxID=304850 RepID=UPI003FD426B6
MGCLLPLVGTLLLISVPVSVGECGGNLTDPKGVITSPNYPRKYNKNEQCFWMTKASPTQRLSLTFNDFELQPGDRDGHCYDYLEVFDGFDTLGKFCGNGVKRTIKSRHSFVKIVFVSNGMFTYRGFNISYRFVDNKHRTDCGGILTAPGGVITSPNYPDNYYHFQKCLWKIKAPPGTRIRLTFNDFKLKPRNEDCNCDDYLEVSDGNGTWGEFCGEDVRHTIKSRNNFVRIVFASSYARDIYKGFNISYEAVDEGSTEPPLNPTTATDKGSTDCGGILTAPGGVITSPNYPDNYYHFQKCLWKIEAPPGTRIRLTFNDFKLQPRNEDCNCDDYLKVYDGNGIWGEFCGEDVRHTIMSRNNFVRIVFTSDARDTDKGFNISYEAVADKGSTECDVTLTDPQGVITSPNYPDKYNNMEHCSWKIKAPEGWRIRLTFNDFKLQPENDSGFCTDYLGLSDGFGHWGTFCGESRLNAFSRENVVQIKFVSDARATATGFNMSYDFVDENSTVCHRTLTDLKGVITSPDYPDGSYTEDLCEWIIVSQRGLRIKTVLKTTGTDTAA